MMKKVFFLLLTTLLLTGCNSIYRYVFYPPERIEYTINPDAATINRKADSAYSVSLDGKAIVYNAKLWKVEIRYMSDYQLNNFEFPDDSKSGELSGNPYTYANWIDPKLGYTPKRFTVFKVSIFNYAGSKLNFDPELASLETDRGDNFVAYAREAKNAKNLSIEDYYKKRKGASGIADDVYEARLGNSRRTMLYFGKPVYKGDSREGLIVFDPTVDAVKKIKLTFKRFITAYDENNDPVDFTDLNFFFKQEPLSEEEKIERGGSTIAIDSTLKNFGVSQIQYTVVPGRNIQYEQVWNPLPRGVQNLIGYAARNSKMRPKYYSGTFEVDQVKRSKLAFISDGGNEPDFSPTFIDAAAKFVEGGGTIFIDRTFFKYETPFAQEYESFAKRVGERVNGKVEFKDIDMGHQIFTKPYKFDKLPDGADDNISSFKKITAFHGLFVNGKLRIIIGGKGYLIGWSEEGTSLETQRQFEFGINLLTYATE